MPVKFRVLQTTGARVIEDREKTLIDVLAKPRTAAFHLLIRIALFNGRTNTMTFTSGASNPVESRSTVTATRGLLLPIS